MTRHTLGILLAIGVLTCAAQPVHAQTDPALVISPRYVAPLDREAWAGISYREAIIGLAALGGGAVVVTWLSSSVISGITAAAAVAAGYVVYDPGVTGVLSPSDLPRLPDLAVNGADQK